MSAVLDISEQRRVEDLSRQQQERRQAAARLLRILVTQTHPRWVEFALVEAGSGIAADVAARLFTLSSRPGLRACVWV